MQDSLDNLCAGDGEMKAMVRAFPWQSHPMGPPLQWPRSLLNIAEMVLNSQFPMFLCWGPELNLVYNDAYRPVLQRKHPGAFMRPLREVWADAWPDIAGIVARALSGQASYFEDFRVVLERDGSPQPAWFTFSYSPLRDDAGVIAGVLCIVHETTARVQGEAQQAFRLRLAESLRSLADPRQIAATAARMLGERLGAARVLYVDIDADAGTFHAHHDWTDGSVSSMAGMDGSLGDYVPGFLDELRAGRSWAVDDVCEDPHMGQGMQANLALGIRSLVNVPIVKEGRLIAALGVHASAPRHWSTDDVRLVEMVAEYAWPAVERSRAERALRERMRAEADRLRELFQAAPSPIVVFQGRSMVIELANEAFHQFAGRRELVGKPLWEAMPDAAGQGFEALLDQVFETGKPFVGRAMKVQLRKDGEAHPRDVYHDALYQPLFGPDGKVSGIFVLANDVTEMIETQQALRDSEERLRQGMTVARMVVWDWDLASDRITLSDNAADLLGRHWLLADELLRHIPAADLEPLAVQRRRASPADPHYGGEFRFIRPDNGETVWLETRAQVLFDEAGKPCLVKGVALDVTERKRSEERLLEASRQKDEFLAMLGHELRNPLAPIRAAADLMTLGRLDDARLRATSRIIARQVDHMTELVDDLLDVSRVTRGLVVLDKTTVDLKRTVADAVEQVGPLIELRRHQLSVQLTPEPACTVGDQKRLVQIVSNILNNAAKYTPEGGHIALSLEAEAGQVRITVRDDGIGIPAALQPHVFDLFRQASRTPDRSQGGLGLGLALVKSLMELHGGKVSVFSEGEGRGSSFTLEFPRCTRDGTGITADAPDAPASARPCRILLVDDNEDAASILAMFLESSGHEVAVACDARAALEAAQEPGRFDACLLDIGLPDIDGYALARRLRGLPGTQDATLVAVTGYGQETDKRLAREAGFDVHLVKPVDMPQLLAVLDRSRLVLTR